MQQVQAAIMPPSGGSSDRQHAWHALLSAVSAVEGQQARPTPSPAQKLAPASSPGTGAATTRSQPLLHRSPSPSVLSAPLPPHPGSGNTQLAKRACGKRQRCPEQPGGTALLAAAKRRCSSLGAAIATAAAAAEQRQLSLLALLARKLDAAVAAAAVPAAPGGALPTHCVPALVVRSGPSSLAAAAPDGGGSRLMAEVCTPTFAGEPVRGHFWRSCSSSPDASSLCLSPLSWAGPALVPSAGPGRQRVVVGAAAGQTQPADISAFQHQYQQRKPQQQQQPPPAVCLSHEDARQLDAARRFLALF
ncbi:hypothetical protein D9Q98_004285 [Chlorella vulgaris]|uniref:Uncharacterized protein n=1 Tax=Chlorella vulgaris TaxID=3077 RepID=A0A9D4YXY9_CHLVU|nr:hypothetical protein D9Q98_004285 [Chlorella vulgaris]